MGHARLYRHTVHDLTGWKGRDYDSAMHATWRRRIVLAVAFVALLAPIAVAAMVPDPTWIAGVYDGADADEILILLWDGTPAVAADSPAMLEPHVGIWIPSPAALHTPLRLARAAVSRAPPLV